MATKACAHCGADFRANKSQAYCSIRCAVWSKIEVKGKDECWPFTGRPTFYGYAAITFAGKPAKISRVVLAERVGPLSDGIHACHRCDNPICCNPGHLFPGTPKDNSDDKIAKGRGYSARGEKHSRTQLTDAEVKAIRSRLRAGEVQRVIAADYGVARHVIADIKAGRSFRYLED